MSRFDVSRWDEEPRVPSHIEICPHCRSDHVSVKLSAPFPGGTISRHGRCDKCKQEWNLPPTSEIAERLKKKIRRVETYVAVATGDQRRRAVITLKRTHGKLNAELKTLGQGWTSTLENLQGDPIDDLRNFAEAAKQGAEIRKGTPIFVSPEAKRILEERFRPGGVVVHVAATEADALKQYEEITGFMKGDE